MRPSFSIVIETDSMGQTDWRCLLACVDAITAQEGVAAAREIILCHDADAPAGILGMITCRYPWLHLSSRGRGYYGQKQQAAVAATGDIIVMVDSDCIPQQGWLRALLEPFDPDTSPIGEAANALVQVVGGDTTVLRNFAGRALAPLYVFPMEGSARQDVHEVDSYYPNNVAIRRTLLLRWPFFDDPMAARHTRHAHMLKAQYRAILRNPAARVLHMPTPWPRFIQRFMEYGRDSALWKYRRLSHRHNFWARLVYAPAHTVAAYTRRTVTRAPSPLNLIAAPIMVAGYFCYVLGALSILTSARAVRRAYD